MACHRIPTRIPDFAELTLSRLLAGTSRGLGSQTTDMGLRDLLTRHLISEEEALFHATDREAVLANRGLPARDRLRR